jgi:sugar lactone lactonase YvrE
MAPTSQVFRVTFDGKVAPYAQLPEVPPNQGFMTGMELDKQGNLYVALASFVPNVQSGIYRVPPGGGQPTLFASGMALPNGLAFDTKGNLFVSDTIPGVVLKITSDGKVNKWAEHDLLKGSKSSCNSKIPDFDAGPNGIAFDDRGDLFVLNTHGASIIRVPVNKDGSAGTPERFVGPDCANLEGADGIAIDEKGNLYVVDFLIHKLVSVGKDKTITVLDSGGLLDSPASLAFGVGQDRDTLYITNFAFVSAAGGGQPKPGVLKKEVGIKGRLLP